MQRSGVLAEAAAKGLPIKAVKNPFREPTTVVVFQDDVPATEAFAHETGLILNQTVLLVDPESKTTLDYYALPCPRVFIPYNTHSERFLDTF